MVHSEIFFQTSHLWVLGFSDNNIIGGISKWKAITSWLTKQQLKHMSKCELTPRSSEVRAVSTSGELRDVYAKWRAAR